MNRSRPRCAKFFRIIDEQARHMRGLVNYDRSADAVTVDEIQHIVT